MRQEKFRCGGAVNGTATNFFADRPKHVEDKNHSEYWLDGVRYYKMLQDGKVFQADIYDAMFTRGAVIGKMKPQNKEKYKADIDPGTGKQSRTWKSKKRKIN